MNGKLTTQHCINSTSKTYDGDQWVTVEAIVLGDSLIQHLMEGQVVLAYQKPRIGESGGDTQRYLNQEWQAKAGMPLKEGYIALQAESQPIWFRNIKIKQLDK